MACYAKNISSIIFPYANSKKITIYNNIKKQNIRYNSNKTYKEYLC